MRGAVPILVALCAFALAACGSASAPSTTRATTVSPGTTAALPPLTGPEQSFLQQLGSAGSGRNPQTLLQLGYDACSRLNYDASSAEQQVATVRAQGGLDDASARAVVRTAAATLCPAASAAALGSTPPPTSAPVAQPLTTVSPGTYEVGTGDGQVAPGKYKSTGPDSGGACYYARLKNNDGGTGDIIANNLSQGPSIMNVKASDGYVQVAGCTFTKAS